jgi:hypothetical protein
VLNVLHFECTHQELLGCVPGIEILRLALGDDHEDDESQAEEIIDNVKLIGLHHAQRKVIQQLLAQKLLSIALEHQLV